LLTGGDSRIHDVKVGSSRMRTIRWLAIVPFLALLIGPFFVNRTTPLVLGLPPLLAWIVAWILITSLIMAVIYGTDPANREGEP
jgi:O-antigen ligase